MGRLFFSLPLLLLCLPLCLLQAPSYPEDLFAATDPTVLQVSDTKKPLPDPDPVRFLKKCLERYDREVKGYTLTFRKRERIDNVLNGTEEILVHFKNDPHSVFFDWKHGARLASRVFYVAGENNGKAMVKARLGGLILLKDVDGDEAKKSGRLRIDQFGLRQALERVQTRFEAAQAKGALHVEYLGVQKLAEVGNRPCYVLRRTKYAEAEDDGVTDLVVFIDTETWLLGGTISKGKAKDKDDNVLDNQLIAYYYFRDVKLNPQFQANQFQRAALTQK
jgi:hypothetical protein